MSIKLYAVGREVRLILVLLCFAGIGLMGCNVAKVAVPESITRQEAMVRYNRNVDAIVPFKARVSQWEAKWVDDKGKAQHHTDSVGSVFYVPPKEADGRALFYLMTKALLDEALVVGSNEEEFWMYSKPAKLGRWGKYEHRNKDCAGAMAVDPQVFLEFIGLSYLSVEAPYPAYKVTDKENVIEIIDYVDDGFRIRREIVIDRRSELPSEINAYDSDGSRIMQSKLSNYTKLGDGWLPGEICISTEDGDSLFRLKLQSFRKLEASNLETYKETLFKRKENPSGIDDYQQIDKECEVE